MASQVYTDVTGWFGRLPGEIGGFFSGIWLTATGWLASLGESASTKASEIWGNITGWFSRLPGEIGGFSLDGVGPHARGVRVPGPLER